jgi:preprotein translocase subunit SecG
MLKVLLVLIEIISGVLLVGVILLQKSKDEGLGLAFGAGVGETLFGSRAGNVLTKITIGLGIVFMVNTLLIGYVFSGATSSGSVTDDLPDRTAVPVRQAPAGEVIPPESTAPLSSKDALPVSQQLSVPPVAPVQAPIQPSEPVSAPAQTSP